MSVVLLFSVARFLVCVWSRTSPSFLVVRRLCVLANLCCGCDGVFLFWGGIAACLLVVAFGVYGLFCLVLVSCVSVVGFRPLRGWCWRVGPATQAWREEASVVLDWLVCGGDGCVGTFPALTVRSVAVLLRVSRGFRSSL